MEIERPSREDEDDGRERAAIEPFRIAIPDEDLDDLAARLARVRWPVEVANEDWRYGVSGAYLRALVDHWRHGYDWRAHERAMNELPQFRTAIEGVPIHFVHARGAGPRPMPILLGHGWPWTFWSTSAAPGATAAATSSAGSPGTTS